MVCLLREGSFAAAQWTARLRTCDSPVADRGSGRRCGLVNGIAALALIVVLAGAGGSLWLLALPEVLRYDRWVTYNSVSYLLSAIRVPVMAAGGVLLGIGIMSRRWRRSRLRFLGIPLLLALVTLAVTGGASLRGGRLFYDDRCFFYMSQVEQAKQMWGNLHRAPRDTDIDAEVINAFLGFTSTCPGGGRYAYGAIGTPARCSVHGPYKPRWLFGAPGLLPAVTRLEGVSGEVAHSNDHGAEGGRLAPPADR